MALGRVVELSVGLPGGLGVLISGLDIDFRIERNIKLEENSCQFVIYNANESTRNEMLRQGNNVVFKAGYTDEGTGAFFIGNIYDADSEKQTVDWVTTIKAVSARGTRLTPVNVPISLTFIPGTLLSAVISQIASLLTLVVNGLQNAAIPLSNGFAYSGTTGGLLRIVKKILEANASAIYIDNNELVIYKIGVPSSFNVVRLTYSGGLLNVKDITKPTDTTKRISFKSLIIPNLQVNGLVNVFTPKLSGTFIVEKLIISGNNYGTGVFQMEGEASQ